jgi:hypothetical protein
MHCEHPESVRLSVVSNAPVTGEQVESMNDAPAGTVMRYLGAGKTYV